MARITKAPDERRSELIATAQRLFYSKGYESTSVNDIVTAVGVAKGTFYHYFDTKLSVLEAMIDSMLTESLTLFDAIIENESLTALEKWRKTMQTSAAWKTAHKDELIAILSVMYSPDNLILNHNLKKETIRRAGPEFSKIIAQGVKEGVFKTDYALESAEIAYSIMASASDFIADIVLNPNKYDNRLQLVKQKLIAIQTAVERVLGAPEGSLPFVDEEFLVKWFEE